MWAFVERRRCKRYRVEWNASLHCVFSGCEEDLHVRVMEASLTGARLALDRLQIGPYHLVVGNSHPDFKLSILLPEGLFMSSIGICWYNWEEDERYFAVGIEFLGLEKEGRNLLEKAVKNL